MVESRSPPRHEMEGHSRGHHRVKRGALSMMLNDVHDELHSQSMVESTKRTEEEEERLFLRLLPAMPKTSCRAQFTFRVRYEHSAERESALTGCTWTPRCFSNSLMREERKAQSQQVNRRFLFDSLPNGLFQFFPRDLSKVRQACRDFLRHHKAIGSLRFFSISSSTVSRIALSHQLTSSRQREDNEEESNR